MLIQYKIKEKSLPKRLDLIVYPPNHGVRHQNYFDTIQGRAEVWRYLGQMLELDCMPPYQIIVLKNVRVTGTAKLPTQVFARFF